MINILIAYTAMCVLAFIICSLMIAFSEGYAKELFIITFLNIFFLIHYLAYKLLRKLVKIKGEKVLGHKPRTARDYSILGATKNESPFLWKNLFIMLLKNKHDTEDIQ